ncbi:hypothetical protein E5288_WYG013129 [Bos mutus]|uniref:Uncharacterized protein n=1 Tax=Bos mutus TaxID=72004 RepID=A0A6B0RCZ6_9CETA|nr:hypothetical protein [Bos mutus]
MSCPPVGGSDGLQPQRLSTRLLRVRTWATLFLSRLAGGLRAASDSQWDDGSFHLDASRTCSTLGLLRIPKSLPDNRGSKMNSACGLCPSIYYALDKRTVVAFEAPRLETSLAEARDFLFSESHFFHLLTGVVWARRILEALHGEYMSHIPSKREKMHSTHRNTNTEELQKLKEDYGYQEVANNLKF